jgi:hypothetical protein
MPPICKPSFLSSAIIYSRAAELIFSALGTVDDRVAYLIIRGFEAVFNFRVYLFFFGSFRTRVAGDAIPVGAIFFVFARFVGRVKGLVAE